MTIRVPTGSTVRTPPVSPSGISSLRIHGKYLPSGSVAFSVMVARQRLAPGTSLDSWSESIIDAGAERRVRVRQSRGECEVILAVPRAGYENIGTFVFAVAGGHGYNIMTDAPADPDAQRDIAEVVASIRFCEGTV
jgi:hypothetical protein